LANRVGILGRQIELYVRFCDAAGNPANADSIPMVEATDADGNVRRLLNKTGVSLVNDPGVYLFSYEIPINAVDGYWTDRWVAEIGGEEVQQSFQFNVLNGGAVKEDVLPVHTPGDDVTFEFNEAEVECINVLLKILRKRLNSDGKVRVDNGNGGFDLVDCPIFSDDELICFLVNSLSEFNQYPHFTSFTFADQIMCTKFVDIIVQGASILALAAQALIERGREFEINDNGISYQPPKVSEMLNTQYTAQLANYMEKLKMIKFSIKPSPKSIGNWKITGISTRYRNLRHRRAGRIY